MSAPAPSTDDGAAVTLTDTSVAPGQVNLGIAHIPAGGQVIITLKARVANNDQANAGVSFANTASYTYTGMPAGLDTASTSAPLTIVEPTVALAKTVANLSQPRRGAERRGYPALHPALHRRRRGGGRSVLRCLRPEDCRQPEPGAGLPKAARPGWTARATPSPTRR